MELSIVGFGALWCANVPPHVAEKVEAILLIRNRLYLICFGTPMTVGVETSSGFSVSQAPMPGDAGRLRPFRRALTALASLV